MTSGYCVWLYKFHFFELTTSHGSGIRNIAIDTGIVPAYLRQRTAGYLKGTPASCDTPLPLLGALDCLQKVAVGHNVFLHLAFGIDSYVNCSHVTDCLKVSYWGTNQARDEGKSALLPQPSCSMCLDLILNRQTPLLVSSYVFIICIYKQDIKHIFSSI